MCAGSSWCDITHVKWSGFIVGIVDSVCGEGGCASTASQEEALWAAALVAIVARSQACINSSSEAEDVQTARNPGPALYPCIYALL